MNDTTELLGLVATIATTALAVLALVGMAVRFVLMPWLREHLIAPLLARLDQLTAELGKTAQDVRVAARMFDGHIDRSAEDRAKLWDAVHDLQDAIRGRRRHRAHRKTRREDHP